MSIKQISVVIPFHRVTENLSVKLLDIINSSFFGQLSEVILCHNGPLLNEFEKAKRIIEGLPKVKLLHISDPGLGHGCRSGIAFATGDYILITAIDFPFGFSDLVEFNKLQEMNQLADIYIGSKLHPKTIISNRSLFRKLSTFIFNILKLIIIPVTLPKDTQGTILIKSSHAKEHLNKTEAAGFFFTTELITLAINQGASFKEVPVIYYADEGKSSVSPLKDGFIFFKSLILLRKKILRINHAK